MADVEMGPSFQAQVRSLPGNDSCCECGQSSPEWASVSFGVLVCLDCSGRHRGLGTHVSFVRSITMDSWSPAQLALMLNSSNARVNAALSYDVPSTRPPSSTLLAKYSSDPALLYRTQLNARAEGRPEPSVIDESLRPMPKISREELLLRTRGSAASSKPGVATFRSGSSKDLRRILLATVVALVAGVMWWLMSLPHKLSPDVESWRNRGRFDVISSGRRMFNVDNFYVGGAAPILSDSFKSSSSAPDGTHVVVLIHGFPSSSFDYHRVYDELGRTLSAQNPNVNVRLIAMDHVGFGLSEKPAGDRSEYTLGRHASNLHSLLDLKGLFPPGAKSAPHIHFVSHDMGDSVLTEFVAQAHESRGLPSRPFASLTFTNGGMEYSLINQRLGQKLLTSRFGPYFVSIVPQFVRRLFSVAQLKSIWGADKSSMSKDVADIVALNDVSGGLDIMHMLCQYLNERPVQEKRWFENLRKTVLCEDGHKPCAADPSKRSAKDRKQTPVHFVWGNRDAVSPMSIPNFVIEKRLNSSGTLVEVEGAGHFWMLEKPGRWVEEITRVISKEIRVAV